jgi:hypothetical protein
VITKGFKCRRGNYNNNWWINRSSCIYVRMHKRGKWYAIKTLVSTKYSSIGHLLYLFQQNNTRKKWLWLWLKFRISALFDLQELCDSLDEFRCFVFPTDYVTGHVAIIRFLPVYIDFHCKPTMRTYIFPFYLYDIIKGQCPIIFDCILSVLFWTCVILQQITICMNRVRWRIILVSCVF